MTHPFLETGAILLIVLVGTLIVLYIRGENATARRERSDGEEDRRNYRISSGHKRY